MKRDDSKKLHRQKLSNSSKIKVPKILYECPAKIIRCKLGKSDIVTIDALDFGYTGAD